MDARYRADYAGEFVVLEAKWAGGKKTETREWIPNPIVNQHISGRAACIGSDLDRQRFNYTILQRHRGGLLGSKKLQVYGTGAIAHEMRLDFAVETQRDNLNKILETGYQRDNIVYTTAQNCIANPGEFYLIPFRPRFIDLVTAVYLAAFDGHEEIFLLGYTDETNGGNSHWVGQLADIFLAYAGTKFYLVGESTRMPDAWVDCDNVQCQNYQDWIGYCDV